jgi:hypothetical protein
VYFTDENGYEEIKKLNGSLLSLAQLPKPLLKQIK